MTDSTATLIRNGRIITACDDYVADVLLQGGIVHTIGQAIEVGPDVRVVDATGLYVLPGGVDTHVHLENVIGPTITADTFATGTKAAAFGGTTTVVDFALQTELDSPLGAIARAQRSADMVPSRAISMVGTGFCNTVSTPAMEARCTTYPQPSMAFERASRSRTSRRLSRCT